MKTYQAEGQRVTVTDHELVKSPFEDACFYDSGTSYAKAEGPRGTYFVDVQGEKRMYHEDGRALRTAEQFREAFPDGVLPEDGDGSGWRWENNSWWAVVAPSDATGEDDEVCDSFEGALATAIEMAGGARRSAE